MTHLRTYASRFVHIALPTRYRLCDELGYGLILDGLAAIALSH